MTLLTKQQILGSDDIKAETVKVPEWGGEVLVAVMSGTARDDFDGSLTDGKGGQDLTNFRAKLAAATIVNERGEREFGVEDIEELGKKSGAALNRVTAVAQRINFLSDAQVEALAKN